MPSELEILLWTQILTFVVSLVTSVIITILTYKLVSTKDKLAREMERDGRLLEECYGPLLEKIKRLSPRLAGASGTIPEMKILVKYDTLEAISNIHAKFQYEFDEQLDKYLKFLLEQSERAGTATTGSMLILRVDIYPDGIKTAEKFKQSLVDLVEKKIQFHKDSRKEKQNQGSLYRILFTKRT